MTATTAAPPLSPAPAPRRDRPDSVLPGDPAPPAEPASPAGGWQAQVLGRAQRLRLETLWVPRTDGTARQVAAIEARLAHAQAMATRARGRGALRGWVTGADREYAWSSLRQAEEALLLIQPEQVVAGKIADVEASAHAHLRVTDPRRRVLEDWVKVWRASEGRRTLSEDDRNLLRMALQAANQTEAEAHGNVRSFRNVLLVTTVALLAVVVAVGVAAFQRPDLVPICAEGLACPPGAQDRADPMGVVQVELFGALGGALAAVVTLSRHRGTRDPHGLPEAQALLKVPAGAATALVAIALLQNGLLPGLAAQSGGVVAAYAALFGFGQQVATRLVDRQVGSVLNPARSRNDPVKTAADDAESP